MRQVVPQFNEQSRAGAGPAQQGSFLVAYSVFAFYIVLLDAEECWTQIVNSLSVLPGVVVPGAPSQKKFVEQFMSGEMTTESVPLIALWLYLLTGLKG